MDDIKSEEFFIDDNTGCDDPLDYWRIRKSELPKMSILARRYLCAPPTSVSSERLFSTSGGICSDKRTRLLPEKLEMLVLLSKNYSLVDCD